MDRFDSLHSNKMMIDKAVDHHSTASACGQCISALLFSAWSPDLRVADFTWQGVSIGPLCTVGPGAVLGEGCVMHPGSHVAGNTYLGKRNIIHR
jgi:hypothetical protein